MGNKIQGEGDYEAARRYNEQVAKTVKKGLPDRVPDSTISDKSLEQAETAGKARAKDGKHDQKDAELMENYVTDKGKHA